MIVRKKRNDGNSIISSETSFSEDSESAPTNIPILNNMTSMKLAIKNMLNNTTVGFNSSEIMTDSRNISSLTMSATEQTILVDNYIGDIINGTITAATPLVGNENFPEDLIWGIDNTVYVI